MTALCRVLTLLLVCVSACFAAADDAPGLLGPHRVGVRLIEIGRADDSVFTAWVFYPAREDGLDTPANIDEGPYPVLSFGHGFLQAVQQYRHTLRVLASHGYLVVASNSHKDPFPDHAQFSADLARCVTHLIKLDARESSWLYGLVDESALALGGHSMGGGAAVRAAESLPVQLVIPLAAAPLRADRGDERNASQKAPGTPVAHLVGSDDRIVIPALTRNLYDRAPAPKLMITIEGGSHCGFLDRPESFGCDRGRIEPRRQLRLARQLMLDILDAYLKDDRDKHDALWDAGATRAGLIFERSPRREREAPSDQ